MRYGVVRLFRAVVERIQEDFALLRSDCKLEYVSPAITCILGYSPDVVVGHCIQDMVHLNDVPRSKT